MQSIIKSGDPTTIDRLVLGENKYIDALYGAFRLDNPRAERFASQRQIEIVARSGKKIEVIVPEKMKIELPQQTKLVNTDVFQIERLNQHVDVIYLLTMRAGWNQVENDISRMVNLDPEGTFLANLISQEAKIPLGTGSVLALGKNNAWIGMIMVHNEARRQGIANAIMQHCVKYALDKGKVINGLDATPIGNTVYGALGYVNSYRIWHSVFQLAEFKDQDYDSNHVRAITPEELQEIIRYDASAFLERTEIIQRLFADGNGGCFVYRDDTGLVQGYCFTRPGRLRPFVGPFIAESEEIARNLLIAASQFLLKSNSHETAFLDTPEIRFADRGIYDAKVFEQAHKPSEHRLSRTLTPVMDFTRMYQLVDYSRAETLVKKFQQAEKLSDNSPGVQTFRDTMNKAVFNYAESLGFMTLEREVLQHKYWGITGPEKG